MNVKISEDSVTFKITEEELNCLLSGTALEHKIPIGSNDFSMVITPKPCEYFEDFKEESTKLILDRCESGFMLYTTMDEIDTLLDMGKSREGISTCVNGVHIYLQVDVRKDSREKKHKE